MSLTLLVLGALALALYIPEKIKGYTIKAVIKKSVVSFLFIAIAVSAGSDSTLSKFVILGLVCGLLGDIWLDFKYIYPKNDKIYTYAGFTFFGVGHILYVTGLIRNYRGGLFLIICFALAVAGSIGNDRLAKYMKLDFGKMRNVVYVYAFLLFCTVFVSGGYLLKNKGTALLLFFLGSISFAASDLVLSGTYFGKGRKRPVDIISNYVLYYAGQFLIAYSLSFI